MPEFSIKIGRTCDWSRIMARLYNKVCSSFLLVLVIDEVLVLSSLSIFHALLNRIILEA